MTDTDSAPIEESAGEGVSEPEASPDVSSDTPEPEAQDLDTVLNAAVEEHFEEDPPDGPVRDEKGRFVSTNPDQEAPPSEASDGEGDADQVEAEAETEVPPLEPPKHWPEADKTRFAEMPKDAQEWALERDKAMTADYTRKTQEIAQERTRYQEIAQQFEPLRAGLQANGMTEAQYVQRLINADQRLQQDPVGAIKWLANQAGVDLATLEPGTDEFVDPQIAALQNQVSQLTNHLATQEQRAAAAKQTELQSTISEFSAATDTDGQPLYPHFETLRHTMGALIQAGQAKGLEDAYAKAVRLDDSLYQEVLEAERKKAEAAEEKRRQEAVDKARHIRPKVPSAPPGGNVVKGDLDSLLEDSISKAGFA